MAFGFFSKGGKPGFLRDKGDPQSVANRTDTEERLRQLVHVDEKKADSSLDMYKFHQERVEALQLPPLDYARLACCGSGGHSRIYN